MDEQEADLSAIRDLIDRQFASMSWPVGKGPDSALFKSDFLPGSQLYPSARPAVATSLDEFAARMSKLAQDGTLSALNEQPLGKQILVFGNVAVAAAASENTENESETTRSVEMMLLVKSGGHWKIAGQAWDKETRSSPIPDVLLGRHQ